MDRGFPGEAKGDRLCRLMCQAVCILEVEERSVDDEDLCQCGCCDDPATCSQQGSPAGDRAKVGRISAAQNINEAKRGVAVAMLSIDDNACALSIKATK